LLLDPSSKLPDYDVLIVLPAQLHKSFDVRGIQARKK
jgi:hypothetical protein